MRYKANLTTRDFSALSGPAGNVYEAVAIIAKRARQIAVRTKEELDNKLADLVSDDIDGQQLEEGKAEEQEQVEISRLYESMPKPTIIAAEEFLRGKLMYRYSEPERHAGSVKSASA